MSGGIRASSSWCKGQGKAGNRRDLTTGKSEFQGTEQEAAPSQTHPGLEFSVTNFTKASSQECGACKGGRHGVQAEIQSAWAV